MLFKPAFITCSLIRLTFPVLLKVSLTRCHYTHFLNFIHSKATVTLTKFRQYSQPWEPEKLPAAETVVSQEFKNFNFLMVKNYKYLIWPECCIIGMQIKALSSAWCVVCQGMGERKSFIGMQHIWASGKESC